MAKIKKGFAGPIYKLSKTRKLKPVDKQTLNATRPAPKARLIKKKPS